MVEYIEKKMSELAEDSQEFKDLNRAWYILTYEPKMITISKKDIALVEKIGQDMIDEMVEDYSQMAIKELGNKCIC